MFIYIIILIILILLALYSSKSSISPSSIFIISLLLILLVGLRGIGVDPDSRNYFETWEKIRTGTSIPIDLSFYLLSSITPNFTILLFIYAIIGVTLKIEAAIKLSPFPYFSILIYFSHFFFLHEMTQIRAGCAAGFLLMVIYFKVNQKKMQAYLSLALAIFFHASAIIGLLFIFLKHKTNNLKNYIFGFSVAVILCWANISVLDLLGYIKLGYIGRKIELYTQLLAQGQHNEIHIFNTAFFIQVLVGFIGYYLCRFQRGNRYTLILTKIYWLGLIFYLIFSKIPVFAFRISELFLIGEYILIPQLMLFVKPSYISKSIVIGSGFILFILYVLILQSVEDYSLNI